MVGASLLIGVLLVFAVGLSLVLYVAVRAEHDQRETMDRNEAEREARRDTRNGE
ncbi:MAG: hypothetical protein ACLFR6_07955 [Salinarchaeum sp.]